MPLSRSAKGAFQLGLFGRILFAAAIIGATVLLRSGALEKNGISAVVSFVSPYDESLQFVRRLCARSIEGYVATPFSVCEQRDAKGLYAKRPLDALMTGPQKQSRPSVCDLATRTDDAAQKAECFYAIIDARGHVEFLKNMITGAARTDTVLQRSLA